MNEASTNIRSQDPARRWLTFLAVAVSVAILSALAGALLVSPALDGSPKAASTPGEVMIVVLFAGGVLSAIISALVHAWHSFRERPGLRFAVIGAIAVTNFLGALAYLVYAGLKRA